MASSQAATSYGPTADQVITWLQGLDEVSKTHVFQVIGKSPTVSFPAVGKSMKL